MTVKYYLRHCCWGLGGCGYLVYIILTGLRDGTIYPAYSPYMPGVAAYLAIGAVVYPFAFYVSEQLAMKIMSRDAWENYFGIDSRLWGAFIFIFIFCVLFVVPLCLVYPFLSKNRPDN